MRNIQPKTVIPFKANHSSTRSQSALRNQSSQEKLMNQKISKLNPSTDSFAQKLMMELFLADGSPRFALAAFSWFMVPTLAGRAKAFVKMTLEWKPIGGGLSGTDEERGYFITEETTTLGSADANVFSVICEMYWVTAVVAIKLAVWKIKKLFAKSFLHSPTPFFWSGGNEVLAQS